MLWLDARNALIEDELMFRGTLTQTSVYPREVVKSALLKTPRPASSITTTRAARPSRSRADELLTRSLKDALGLVDVRVLDHLIVAGVGNPTSFAERGLL